MLVNSCTTDKNPWEGKCPLERLDWMKVSNGYDSETVVQLAAELKAAADADVKLIKGFKDLDASASFNSSLDKVVEKSARTETEVSQEFYESYIRQRTQLCALFEALQADPPIYTTEKAREKAEEAFTIVAQKFDEVKQETVDKSIVLNIDKYVESGLKEFEKENWTDAKFYFDALVKSDPENIDFLERRGYCNFGLKRFEQALADFNKAIENTDINQSPQLLFFRGNTLSELKKHERAIEDFNKMLTIQPRHMGATNQRGLAYAKAGKKQEACKDFEKVIQFGVKNLKEKAQFNLEKYCK